MGFKRRVEYDFSSFLSAHLTTKNYTTVHEICPLQNLVKYEDLLGFSVIQDPSLAHILYSIPSSVYVCTPLPGDSKHVERKPFGSILTQSSRDRCTRASQPSTKNLHTRRLLLLLCQCSFTLLILLAVYSNTYKKHYSYGEKKESA